MLLEAREAFSIPHQFSCTAGRQRLIPNGSFSWPGTSSPVAETPFKVGPWILFWLKKWCQACHFETNWDRQGHFFCIFLLKFLKCQFAWENINFEWTKPLFTWPQQQQTCKTLTQNHQPGRTNCVLWACCLQRCPARTQHPSRRLQGVWKH